MNANNIVLGDESNSSQPAEEGLLRPLDEYRENDPNVTRAGIIDLFRMPLVDDGTTTAASTTLGLCHIAFYNMFSVVTPGGRFPLPFADLIVGGFAAAHLAIQMLTDGDDSVVPELKGLNEVCPIRFTMEAFDTAISPNVAAESIQDVLKRQTERGEREVCAVLGSEGTRTSTSLAFLTGLQDRPQLSPIASGSQLDDNEMFPLFGRLATTDLTQMLPLVMFLKAKGVSHVGVVHWNEEQGNALVRSINAIAAQYYPELSIVAADIPSVGATALDLSNALDILQKTQYRWFYTSISADDVALLIEKAVEMGMAGTGEHTWIHYGSTLSQFNGKEVEKQSALARGMRGSGFFVPKFGRPGMPIFDKFVQAWQGLDNPSDLALLTSRLVTYPEDVTYPPPEARSIAFALDPSAFASIVFDTTIMFGLSACSAFASSSSSSPADIHLDGSTMFQHLLNTTFQGATGRCAVDPKTGSRLPETAVFVMANLLERDLNETHVTLTSVDSGVYVDGDWTFEETFVFNDGTTRIPSDLPPIETETVYIGRGLRIFGMVLVSLIALSSLAFAAWTIVKRNDRVVRASQPIFLLLVCLGTFIMSLAIVPLSIDDEIASEQACDVACMASPWFASIGFCFIFSALFSKTWRINRILNSPNLHRVKVTALDVMSPLLGLLVCDVVILAAWTATSPLQWEREISLTDAFGRELESRGKCTSDGFIPFVVLLGVIAALALCLATWQAYCARGVATEFAESDFIARAILCMILVSAIGVPTMILVSDDAKAQFFALTSIIFVLCAAVLLCIFVPKIRASIKGDFNAKRAVQSSLTTPLRSSEVTSSDEQSEAVGGVEIFNSAAMLEKFRAENERLKKEIAELKEQNNPEGGFESTTSATMATDSSTSRVLSSKKISTSAESFTQEAGLESSTLAEPEIESFIHEPTDEPS